MLATGSTPSWRDYAPEGRAYPPARKPYGLEAGSEKMLNGAAHGARRDTANHKRRIQKTEGKHEIRKQALARITRIARTHQANGGQAHTDKRGHLTTRSPSAGSGSLESQSTRRKHAGSKPTRSLKLKTKCTWFSVFLLPVFCSSHSDCFAVPLSQREESPFRLRGQGHAENSREIRQD